MPSYMPSLTTTKFLHSLTLFEDTAITYADETLATTDHTFTGWKINAVAGEALAFPYLCYFKNDSKFWRTDADAAGTTEGLLTIAVETIAADGTGGFLLRGFIRDDSWAWTVGAIIYVSLATGGLTETAPVAAGDQVRKVGVAISADVMWFNPDDTIVEMV